MQKKAPDFLREGADIYEERNKIYGDNYKKFGGVMHAMFPDGLNISTLTDWNRLGVLVQVMSKIGRYAENFDKGGHEDSVVDASVYLSMLAELDQVPPEVAES